MGKTSIEWTDKVWNPVTGCSKVSSGCANCYAETVDRRFASTRSGEFKPWTSPNAVHNVRWHPERLMQPMRWKKPQRVFVDSMGDLFHERVPDRFLDFVFAAMAMCYRCSKTDENNVAIEFHQPHTFQILTKRPDRMKEYVNRLVEGLNVSLEASLSSSFAKASRKLAAEAKMPFWPNAPFTTIRWVADGMPGLWLGVSVENQQAADERIPLLLETPAAVRFLSCEPLLGHVELLDNHFLHQKAAHVDWVIAGGESGPNARPMHPNWVKSLRDQCVAAGVPLFFKQWGSWLPMFEQPWEKRPTGNCRIVNIEGGEGYHGDGAMWTKHMGKANAGRKLDGRTWDEIPQGR